MFSVHEATWDRETKRHTCCGSAHSYHRTNCQVRKLNVPPGRTSDPDFVNVQILKKDGLNSGQIARRLNLPLEYVNELFIL